MGCIKECFIPTRPMLVFNNTFYNDGNYNYSDDHLLSIDTVGDSDYHE